MLKTILLAASIAVLGTGFGYAQDSAADNPHKKHDDKLRNCRKQAADQGLQGDARQAFITECMKKP